MHLVEHIKENPMNKWNHTLNLSDVWNDSWNDSNVHELGKGLAERLKLKFKAYEDDYTLLEIIEMFESICTEDEAKDINADNLDFHHKQLAEGKDNFHFDIVPMEEFNEQMRSLYDWADSERVWIKKF